jgi:hypothetical protein
LNVFSFYKFSSSLSLTQKYFRTYITAWANPYEKDIARKRWQVREKEERCENVTEWLLWKYTSKSVLKVAEN